MVSKRLVRSWLPFAMGVATAVLALTLASIVRLGPSAPAESVQPIDQGRVIDAKPPAQLAPADEPGAAPMPQGVAQEPAPLIAAPALAPASLGSEPPDVVRADPQTPAAAMPTLAPHSAPAEQVMVMVTATAPLPTMAPVQVTPTAVLTQAEQEARTRRAVEAMQQSTENAPITPGEMPPPQP